MSKNALQLEISIIDEQSDLPIDPLATQNLVREVLLQEGVTCNALTIHFVDEPTISKLHADYFDDPTPTDCITFPVDAPSTPEPCLLGEVFVCPRVAIAYADAHQKEPFAETTLYIVHGLLHLFGYDDIDPVDQKRMREAEKRHIDNLLTKNLLLTHSNG